MYLKCILYFLYVFIETRIKRRKLSWKLAGWLLIHSSLDANLWPHCSKRQKKINIVDIVHMTWTRCWYYPAGFFCHQYVFIPSFFVIAPETSMARRVSLRWPHRMQTLKRIMMSKYFTKWWPESLKLTPLPQLVFSSTSWALGSHVRKMENEKEAICFNIFLCLRFR